jgi:2-hydroxy-3-oxopropionate reductase
MAKLGFIGPGIMGAPMAANLLRGGHQLFVHGRSFVPAALIEGGATQCASPREVAEQSEFIFIMVPDTPDVERVLFGENGVASGLDNGQVVVDMSSISPMATKEFAAKINALGSKYLDAPVSGGEVGAKAGTLTIMVGGPKETFEEVKPFFDLMGKNITLVGENGDGQTTKVANQIIVALNIQAVSEALLVRLQSGRGPVQGATGVDGWIRSVENPRDSW